MFTLDVRLALFHLQHISIFSYFTIFLLAAFTAWKRMILYEKTRFAVVVWFIFETALFISLGSHFFHLTESEIIINTTRALFFIWIMVLSVNLKWVPHLVFNQKVFRKFIEPKLFVIKIAKYAMKSF